MRSKLNSKFIPASMRAAFIRQLGRKLCQRFSSEFVGITFAVPLLACHMRNNAVDDAGLFASRALLHTKKTGLVNLELLLLLRSVLQHPELLSGCV